MIRERFSEAQDDVRFRYFVQEKRGQAPGFVDLLDEVLFRGAQYRHGRGTGEDPDVPLFLCVPDESLEIGESGLLQPHEDGGLVVLVHLREGDLRDPFSCQSVDRLVPKQYPYGHFRDRGRHYSREKIHEGRVGLRANEIAEQVSEEVSNGEKTVTGKIH